MLPATIAIGISVKIRNAVVRRRGGGRGTQPRTGPDDPRSCDAPFARASGAYRGARGVASWGKHGKVVDGKNGSKYTVDVDLKFQPDPTLVGADEISLPEAVARHGDPQGRSPRRHITHGDLPQRLRPSRARRGSRRPGRPGADRDRGGGTRAAARTARGPRRGTSDGVRRRDHEQPVLLSASDFANRFLRRLDGEDPELAEDPADRDRSMKAGCDWLITALTRTLKLSRRGSGGGRRLCRSGAGRAARGGHSRVGSAGLPAPTMIGDRCSWISSISPARNAWAASSGPAMPRSRSDSAFMGGRPRGRSRADARPRARRRLERTRVDDLVRRPPDLCEVANYRILVVDGLPRQQHLVHAAPEQPGPDRPGEVIDVRVYDLVRHGPVPLALFVGDEAVERRNRRVDELGHGRDGTRPVRSYDPPSPYPKHPPTTGPCG